MSTLLQSDQLRTLNQGIFVSRATDTLPATTDEALFTITGGRVFLLGILGEVTTVIQTQANNTKLKFNPSATGSDVDLCAVLDITADAVGTYYTITGTFATAMQGATVHCAAANTMLPQPVILGAGDIEIDCAATNTGSVKWDMWYVPLDKGASVAATAV